MKKRFGKLKKFCCMLISAGCILFPPTVSAQDRPDEYGDGTAFTWAQIRNYLDAPYKYTECISLKTSGGTKHFYFNVELFMDKGLCAYGDPAAVSLTGVVNDFKPTADGYYRASVSGKSVRGEYRYSGLSYSGFPMSNTRFPQSTGTSNSTDFTLIKYSDLSNSLKDLYGIRHASNDAFLSLRDWIDSQESPVWEFTNGTAPDRVWTLGEKLKSLGFFENGKPTVSIFEYGVINYWGNRGGSVRVFYQSKSDPDHIRYATFTSPASLRLNKVPPALTCIVTADGQRGGTVVLGSDRQELTLQVRVRGILTDRYGKLTDLEKGFLYTRDDLSSSHLFFRGEAVPADSISRQEDALSFISAEIPLTISRLHYAPGKYTLQINGAAQVFFGQTVSFKAQDSITLDLYIMPEPDPSASVSPEESAATPEPAAQSPLPVCTPDINLIRRW